MKKTFSKITAMTLAILTFVFTFCITSFASEERKGGALVYVNSQCHYYQDPAKAWSRAVTGYSETKMVLLQDWEADENGNMGKGEGFQDGALSIKNKNNGITLDLNGYKIDRGLTEAQENGYVFYIYGSNKIRITDSSSAKTGTISGGFNKSKGGAFQIHGSIVTIENIRIENNRTRDRGGALWALGISKNGLISDAIITVDNCIITGNSAKSGGAAYLGSTVTIKIFDSIIAKNSAAEDGGIHTEVYGFNVTSVILGGRVIIAENHTKKDGEGLMLDESLILKVYVCYDKERPLKEGSKIVILSKTWDRNLRITDDSSEHHFDCYEYENDEYTIVKKGSGNEKYLNIKKA